MNVHWMKCQGDIWCNLNTVNLEHEHFDSLEGVYIIWHGGSPSQTVRVGQGIIKDRLKQHRKDPEIKEYADYTLLVTWAEVSSDSRDGVERYLANVLDPLVGERFPNSDTIEVNLPW